MAIKHAKVSAKADGGDASLVLPSDWNNNHVIDPATVTYAMIQNVTAARVLGSIAGGAPAELTASQIFDLVSNTNGVLLTRTGGTWGALANWTTDNGDLVAVENYTPAAPAAGTVKVHGVKSGGRPMLASIGPAGARMIAQPLAASRHWWSAEARNDGANVLSAYNTRVDLGGGTLTARTPTGASLFASSHRVGIVSGAIAGNISNERSSTVWCSRFGGFYLYARFGVSDAVLVGTANMFVGVSATTAALADVGPETLVNLIGIGCTNGDTVMQLYAAGAAAQARTSLGANFPVNTISAELYDAILYCPPNSSSVTWEVIRLTTGDRASGTISAGANLPASTTMLTWQVQRSNGGAASAVGIDLCSIHGETDY